MLVYGILISLALVETHLFSFSHGKNIKQYCIDSKYHKQEPSAESELFGQCTPWKNNSCCNSNTSVILHSGLYNFNFNHCSGVKNMSEACRKHFIQDACFYECSPNVGPWVVSVNMKIRKERFFKVPLCASECDNWFSDCKEDFTCAKNWVKDFTWNGTNNCRHGATCVTYEQMFGNAETFCEMVWDHSWEYTSDNKPCMKMWFNGDGENPNDFVTKHKIRTSNNSSTRYNITTFCKNIYVTASLMYIANVFINVVLLEQDAA